MLRKEKGKVIVLYLIRQRNENYKEKKFQNHVENCKEERKCLFKQNNFLMMIWISSTKSENLSFHDENDVIMEEDMHS